MSLLITGSEGFIGKNLKTELINRGYKDIDCFDVNSSESDLEKYLKRASFIFHLAGTNRPKNAEEFIKGNRDLVDKITSYLRKIGSKCTILMSSSIKADEDNEYGISKKLGEEVLKEHSINNESNIMIYRLPNVFGKWCKPNYNSVIATFCHNIAREIDININSPDAILNLVYIDDVVEEFIKAYKEDSIRKDLYYSINKVYSEKLQDISEYIYSFKKSRENKFIPDMGNEFIKKLYSTYLTYLPEDDLSYPLKMNIDERGSFTEFIRTTERGQLSINISKPGIIKGNHWHHTKNEKFLVVSGKGIIRLRKLDSDKVIDYYVDSEKLEVIDIPSGYTHNIENLGEKDMVTIMWVNECFDENKPDTFYLEV